VEEEAGKGKGRGRAEGGKGRGGKGKGSPRSASSLKEKVFEKEEADSVVVNEVENVEDIIEEEDAPNDDFKFLRRISLVAPVNSIGSTAAAEPLAKKKSSMGAIWGFTSSIIEDADDDDDDEEPLFEPEIKDDDLDLDDSKVVSKGESKLDGDTIVYNGKRLTTEEAQTLIESMRPKGTRRRRVGGGFQNEVLDPHTDMWINSDRYFKRYPLLKLLSEQLKGPRAATDPKPKFDMSKLQNSNLGVRKNPKASTKKNDALKDLSF
jgi:hypothetical protein